MNAQAAGTAGNMISLGERREVAPPFIAVDPMRATPPVLAPVVVILTRMSGR